MINRIGRLEKVVDNCIERMINERKTVQIDAICLLINAYANQKGMMKFYFYLRQEIIVINIFIYIDNRGKVPPPTIVLTGDQLVVYDLE